MIVVGLTGKACSGKNVVADAMEERGWRVVDVDKLGHPVLEASRDSLSAAFGPSVIRDGRVDRKRLGSIVFADREKLRALEAITHPKMVEECRRIIGGEKGVGVVLNAAVLRRMGLDTLCDVVIFVKSPWYARYRRAKVRDSMSYRQFMQREKAQKDITEKAVEKGKRVMVIVNDGSLSSLHRQVAACCATLLGKG